MLSKAPDFDGSPERQVVVPSALRDQLAYCADNPDGILFLDIETTGLSHYYDEITVVGWSLAGRAHTLVKGEASARLFEDAFRAHAIVTFNGIRFDARFLRQEFPGIRLPALHIDLMYLCRRVGLTGGQKSIERQLELELRHELADVDGFAAVLLWHRYLRGDREALQRLIRYNRADIAAMGALFDEAVSRLLIAPDLFSTQTTFLDWSAPSGWRDVPRPEELPSPQFTTVTFDSLFAGTAGNSASVVGIDLTGSEHRASGWCWLQGADAHTRVLSTDDEILDATISVKPDLVSIDSPLCLPFGRVSVDDSDPGRQTYGIMRWSERELKRRGVNVYPCLLPSMQKLTARGIRLADALRKQGIPVIESYPGAAQDIMRIPRKGAGETWLKLGLSEFGISGAYKHNKVSHDELDAITSALVGTFHLAGMSEGLGTDDEAPLIIPNPNAKTGSLVIGISGPIGAGKTTLAKALAKEGFAYTRFSEVIDDLLRERGEEVNRASRQRLGNEINASGRQRWLAERTLAKVEGAAQIVVDGLRFPDDHAYLVERFGHRFHHVYIDANETTRRGRVRDRSTDADFDAAQQAEVERDVVLMRGLAHRIIENEGSVEAFEGRADTLVTSP